MKSIWLDSAMAYDGTQLRSLFGYLDHGLLGDSIVSWRGPCLITPEHIVDGEDLRAGERICGDDMVHFIVEIFDCTLLGAVAFQRVLAATAQSVLLELSAAGRTGLRRDGDDLYFGAGKLSISIATQSPISSLIHFAVNVTNAGTPVKTASLEDLGVEPEAFAARVRSAYVEEVESAKAATQKVRWVR